MEFGKYIRTETESEREAIERMWARIKKAQARTDDVARFKDVNATVGVTFRTYLVLFNRWRFPIKEK